MKNGHSSNEVNIFDFNHSNYGKNLNFNKNLNQVLNNKVLILFDRLFIK